MERENTPKVSIVLPTFNGEEYLRTSIDSCLNQTFSDFELIIVDDCSTDNTPDIVKSYDDGRIRSIRNDENMRLPRSLNKGFKEARGQFLTWTSDDNFYAPNALEKMVSYLEKENADFVYCDIFVVKDDDEENAVPENLDDADTLHQHNCIRACFLYTRKVLEETGDYDFDAELIEDYDYWVRVSQKFQIHHIKEPLYFYRYHPKSLWGSRIREIKVVEFLFKLKYQFNKQDEVNWYLRNLIIKQKKAQNSWNRAIVNILYKSRIDNVLNRFKKGNIGFSKAREDLNVIINDKNGKKKTTPDI